MDKRKQQKHDSFLRWSNCCYSPCKLHTRGKRSPAGRELQSSILKGKTACGDVAGGEPSARPVWSNGLKTKNPKNQASLSLICFICYTCNRKLSQKAYLHFFPCKLQGITKNSKKTMECYTFLKILPTYRVKMFFIHYVWALTTRKYCFFPLYFHAPQYL